MRYLKCGLSYQFVSKSETTCLVFAYSVPSALNLQSSDLILGEVLHQSSQSDADSSFAQH